MKEKRLSWEEMNQTKGGSQQNSEYLLYIINKKKLPLLNSYIALVVINLIYIISNLQRNWARKVFILFYRDKKMSEGNYIPSLESNRLSIG